MSRRRLAVFAAIASAVLAADQVTKALVRAYIGLHDQITLLPDILWLTHVQNDGAAFGVLDGGRWLFVTISAVVLVVILWALFALASQSRTLLAGLGLVFGGAVGNMIDRIVVGTVTDFFDLGWFPVFNIADIALDVGVALIVLWLLFSPEHRAADAREQAPGPDDPAAGHGGGGPAS